MNRKSNKRNSKKRSFGIIGMCATAVIMGLSACGMQEKSENVKTDRESEIVKANEKETESKIQKVTESITEEASQVINPTEVVYEEKGNIFLISSVNTYGDEYVDGEFILSEEERANYSRPVWQNIYIMDEITIYDISKHSIGHTKSNFDAILIQEYGEWTYIDVCGGADTAYAVRTDELKKAMVIKEGVAIETEPEESETQYVEQETQYVENETEKPTDYVENKTENTNIESQTTKPENSQQSQPKHCTPEEMVEMLNKAFEEQGFMFNPNYEEQGKFKYDVLYLTPVFSYDSAKNWAKTYSYRGYNLCWVEYVKTNESGDYGIKIYTGTRPDYIRTPEEVISMLEKAYNEVGCIKSTDRMTPEQIEEYGPQDGMGWGLGYIEPDFTYEDAVEDAKKSLKMGYNVYYFEYIETYMNGTVVIKGYHGSAN